MNNPEERVSFLQRPYTAPPSVTPLYRLLYGLIITGAVAQAGCLFADLYYSMTIVMTTATFPMDFSIWLLVNGTAGLALGVAMGVGICGGGDAKCVSYLFVIWNIVVNGWTLLGWWTMGASYGALAGVVSYLWCRMVLQTLVGAGSIVYLIRHLHGPV